MAVLLAGCGTRGPLELPGAGSAASSNPPATEAPAAATRPK